MRYVSEWYRQVMLMPPRRRKALLVCLWCLAPVEMAVITGIFYLGRKIHQNYYVSGRPAGV